MFPVMGSSPSSLLLPPKSGSPTVLGQREDTVKLEDFLSQQEEDLWRPRGKLRLSVGKLHVVRSIRYQQLKASEGPTKGGLVNQAFVQADQRVMNRSPEEPLS